MVGSEEHAGSSGEARTATVLRTRALQRRRIIERSRLVSLLDESSARVKTLVAPAGFGKTTLAGQWIESGGRHGAWYTARRASTDVAALALGLARAASELVEGCDVRLREHLRAVPNPAEHVEVLAEILGEDVADWPSEGWLVLDEYQELVEAPAAEGFIAELVSASPVQLLIASRVRPSWVTGRSILYGETLELNQTELAMDSREAAELLAGRSGQSATGLVALADGWPAVIGLASVSSAEIDGEDDVPESLYRFFAEEVFDALGEDVRAGLATLALAPVLDRELAGALLGPERVEAVCAAALDVGILEERDSQLELHPLARSFLDESSGQTRPEPDSAAASKCLGYYAARRDWDAAFELIARRGMTTELESLLVAALDELLNAARLSTIERWCALASASRREGSAFLVARAEVSLRRGRHAEAQALAESAAEDETELTFRALTVAARAAHLASREEEALALYKRAEAEATSEDDRRDALWGQLMCAIELELPEATAILNQLSHDVRVSDPRDLVRAAANQLSYRQRFGALDLSDADLAWELLDTVSDPLVQSAFQSAYSAGLSLAARYEESLEVARALLTTAREYHLDFAMPYAHYAAAMAHGGMREWVKAEDQLAAGIEASRAGRNANAQQLVFSLQLRLLAQQGRNEEALALELPSLRHSLAAARAEVIGSRALVLACAGHIRSARDLVGEVIGSTNAVEGVVLTSAVQAISALKGREEGMVELAARLAQTAFTTGALDLLVTAYRSAPELLTVLLRLPDTRDDLVRLLHQAHDADLAEAAGQPTSLRDPRNRLSARERDVYDLLLRGLSNKQIAEVLFISPATVKVHAHHIYDKLGTRSRTALAVQAALRDADQATSATGDSEATGSAS